MARKNKVSMAAVAEEAGVSKAAVSYVINNKPGVSEEVQERIFSAIEKLDYKPKSGEIIRDKKNKPILNNRFAVIFPDTEYRLYTNPFYSQLLYHLEREIVDRGGVVSIYSETDILRHPPGRMNGYINIGLGLSHYRPRIKVFGRYYCYGDLQSDQVGPDNDAVGIYAAKYLIAKGHKHVAFINPYYSHSVADVRRDNFFEYARQHNTKTLYFHLPILERTADGSGALARYENLPQLQEFIHTFLGLEDKPTAIFIPSDSHLVIVQNAMQKNNIRVGIDVELVGCNNEVPIISGLEPKPATIDLNLDEIARKSVENLIHRMASIDRPYIRISVQPQIVKAGNGVKKRW